MESHITLITSHDLSAEKGQRIEKRWRLVDISDVLLVVRFSNKRENQEREYFGSEESTLGEYTNSTVHMIFDDKTIVLYF
jgi:hypothetical protein